MFQINEKYFSIKFLKTLKINSREVCCKIYKHLARSNSSQVYCSREICRDYLKGKCSRDLACRYIHNTNDPDLEVCLDWIQVILS